MASPVKVLVCGDSNGNLDDLMNRVATVNAKAGPFSCLFCVGEVRFLVALAVHDDPGSTGKLAGMPFIGEGLGVDA